MSTRPSLFCRGHFSVCKIKGVNGWKNRREQSDPKSPVSCLNLPENRPKQITEQFSHCLNKHFFLEERNLGQALFFCFTPAAAENSNNEWGPDSVALKVAFCLHLYKMCRRQCEMCISRLEKGLFQTAIVVLYQDKASGHPKMSVVRGLRGSFWECIWRETFS